MKLQHIIVSCCHQTV